MVRASGRPETPRHHPWTPLIIAGLSLVALSFLVWGLTEGEPVSGIYVAPHLEHGKVVPGHGRGKKLGAATANLDCDDQLIPADGVYAARCIIDSHTYPVALSIGVRLTIGMLIAKP